jgi:mRNA-degrading endonuclease toxin of MazEF toxin-antitoxin module
MTMATPSSAKRRPAPGDVIPYGYLWSHESDAGREEPVKERPCVVVLAVGVGENPIILVAPITSQEPEKPDAIPLSAGAVGLNRPSWIIPWEVNTFRWIGPDVGRAANPVGAWWRLGALAPELRNLLADRVQAFLVQRKGRIVQRTE